MNGSAHSGAGSVTADIQPGIGVAAAMQMLRERFEHLGIASAALDARLLVCAAVGISHEQFVSDPDRLLSPEAVAVLDGFSERRASREPVSRILGEREFWGRRFLVSPSTLDPRPDSETMIEALLSAPVDALGASPLIVDLGTGSGCLLITLLCEWPHAEGVAVDIDQDAIVTARENARRHGVADRSTFLCGNWLDAVAGKFDLILSNPPYIRSGEIGALEPEVARHDPRRALDGGADGLDSYRDIAHVARHRLTGRGGLVLELGSGQLEAVTELLQQCGYDVVRSVSDLSGTPRCLWATHSAEMPVAREKRVGNA